MIFEHKHTPPPASLVERLKRRVRLWAARKLLGDTPLIWTSQGNLPEESLEWSWRWEITPTNVAYVSVHKLDGVVVKEAPAILMLGDTQAMGLKQGVVAG